ncbi:phospho-sugar mutase [Caldalkalibacillus thermarum TA2.A1]|uniref:Phosphoglucomutase n=2 Tax=Caldalkalibacillus thermarum (strain TA2.A1) TaxID=986075 RepID=A0A8X8IAK4_CALTT|nr:phospho-sugar mutase [Caldalkalibacillus thermarum]QZT33890.1 phospho-sugar mutase [Caldalkalibacillus thermarum TA2.A1]
MNLEQERYQRWINAPGLDPALRKELEAITDQPAEITERFYTHLSFGTGGMRGEIGAGTNRMNIYTIRKATLGLAHYLHNRKRGDLNPEQSNNMSPSKQNKDDLQVVIAYDCRHQSDRFALEAALTLARQGIKAYLFPALAPTPQLSFAVRRLQADAGIMITASHNPPEYNGYKVYGPDGAQLNVQDAEQLMREIGRVEDELSIEVLRQEEAIDQGLLVYLDEQIDREYVRYVTSLSLRPEIIKQMGDQYKIVFTPLHGAATKPVQAVLREAGFRQVYMVEEQVTPDPDFSTVASPNPEEHEAFTLAIEKARAVDADLIMGTDPDADRMGLVVRDDQGAYRVLTGNQTGALLLHYILTQKQAQGKLAPNHTICKTIVTSELGRVIGRDFGLETIDTLTGFKFIGEKIKQFKAAGDRQFLFGYEESYGYLIGDEVRDKDAVQAVLLAAEMGAYYKAKGLTLYEALLDLYEQYGYYREDLISVTLKGREGLQQIKQTMAMLREHPPHTLAGQPVAVLEDYQTQVRHDLVQDKQEPLHLPASNVLKFILQDETWVCVRPSGTEPKLKLYIGVKGESLDEAENKLQAVKKALKELVSL